MNPYTEEELMNAPLERLGNLVPMPPWETEEFQTMLIAEEIISACELTLDNRINLSYIVP